MYNKRGQTTIFIIIGILIVAGVLIFFFLSNEKIRNPFVSAEENPERFISICIEKALREKLETIMIQGGYMENSLNKTFKFTKENKYQDISYLCYTQNNYVSCLNQEPNLIFHLQNEVKKNIETEVRDCIDQLSFSLDENGYMTETSYKDFDLKLSEEKIEINIDSKIITTKNDETREYKNFKIDVVTGIYNLGITAIEIVNQESRFCNFNYLGFMYLYPQYGIDKFRTTDSEEIYTITYKKTNEKFRFAIRGCVISPEI